MHKVLQVKGVVEELLLWCLIEADHSDHSDQRQRVENRGELRRKVENITTPRQNASRPLVVRVTTCMASRLQGVHGPIWSHGVVHFQARNVPQFIALMISIYH